MTHFNNGTMRSKASLPFANICHWNYEHSMHLEYDKYHFVPRSDMSGGPSAYSSI